MDINQFYIKLKSKPSLSEKLDLELLAKNNGPAYRWFYDNWQNETEPEMFDIRLWHIYGALSTMGVCTIDHESVIFTSPIQEYVLAPSRHDACIVEMGEIGFTASMDNGDIVGRGLSRWAEIVDVFVARYGVRL